MRIGSVFKTCARYYLFFLLACASCAVAGPSHTLPDGEVLQDPTKPQIWVAPAELERPKLKEAEFELNYIVASGNEKRAMINGFKVVEGDVVSGATIKRINSDSVYLIYKGKHKELRMNKVTGIQRN